MESMLVEQSLFKPPSLVNNMAAYNQQIQREKKVVDSIESQLAVMKKNEKKYVLYHPSLFYCQYYDVVFSLMSDFEKKFKTSQQTKLVALYYFCKFVESVPVDYQMYDVYSLVCMFIACKYEETQCAIPSVTDILLSYPSVCMSLDEFLSLEMDVLKGLRWRLGCITAAHFLEAVCYHPQVIEYVNTHISTNHFQYKPLDIVISFCHFFLDILSSHYSFRQYSPSIQACACFILTLHVFHIKPLWNHIEEKLFNITSDDVRLCASNLWYIYCKDYSDYVSPSDKDSFDI